MHIIAIENFTKDYGNKKGVFDISLHIEKGEVYGYLGLMGWKINDFKAFDWL